MSDAICGEALTVRDGRCDAPVKHPDGKCGMHSEHSDSPTSARTIQEPLLQEFLDREKDRRAANTYDNRITGLRAFDEWMEDNDKDVLEVGQMSIEDFAQWLKNGRGVSDGTAAIYVEQVSVFYQYLVKREQEEFQTQNLTNPVAAAREGELPDIIKDRFTTVRAKLMKDDTGYRAMSPEEYAQFSGHLPAPKARNELLFQLLWDTGLRPVEACGIEYDADIDREDRKISIRSEKTHLNRTVFYGEKVATLLDIWLGPEDGGEFAVGERERYNPAEPSPYLFVTHETEQLTPDAIGNNFARAAEAAGLRDEPLGTDANGHEIYELDAYSLRHGFAERMVDKGVDLETLRDVMGHKNLETTKKYVNPDEETKRNRIQGALDD